MSTAPAWNRGSQYSRDTGRAPAQGRPNLRVIETYVPTAAETIAVLDDTYTHEARKLLAVMRDAGTTLARQRVVEHQLSCMGLAYCAQSDKLTRKRTAE